MPKVRADAWYAHLYSWGFMIAGGVMVLIGLIMLVESSRDYDTPFMAMGILVPGLFNVGIGLWNYHRIQSGKRRIARYPTMSRDWGIQGRFEVKKSRERIPIVQTPAAKVQEELMLGIQNFHRGEYSLAILKFSRILREPKITPEVKCTLYGLLARCYYLEEEWKKAAYASSRLFQESTTSEYNLSYEDYLVRIECLLKINEFKQAKSLLETAKTIFNTKPELEQLEAKIKL